jgi:hypothetical protein
MDYEKYYQKSRNLTSEDFKQIIGVKKETFTAMLKELGEKYVQKHEKGGRPSKMPLEIQLIIALKYLRQYVTQLELAFEFEVGEATIHDTIVWVENTLIKSGKFNVPGKKELLNPDTEIETLLIDVTESPIERPKYDQENSYSGKNNFAECEIFNIQ